MLNRRAGKMDPRRMTTPALTVVPSPAAWRELPAEQVLRRDRSMRFERGSAVYATDGRVGQVWSIVVDHTSGEITDLIVEVKALKKRVVMPVGLVDKTAGSSVFLRIDRDTFAQGAVAAVGYQRGGFRPARLRSLRKLAKAALADQRELALAEVERDHVETATVRRFDLMARGTRGGS